MSGLNHNDWENDPVWKLVDDAEAPEAGPLFVSNVMREVRLSGESATPWWRHLLSPKPLAAGALAAAAAITIVASLNPGTPDTPPLADTPAIQAAQEVDDLLNEELLLAASEDPSSFSDEALVAMLY